MVSARQGKPLSHDGLVSLVCVGRNGLARIETSARRDIRVTVQGDVQGDARASAEDAATDAETDDWRAQLFLLYETHNPTKMDQIEYLLKKCAPPRSIHPQIRY